MPMTVACAMLTIAHAGLMPRYKTKASGVARPIRPVPADLSIGDPLHDPRRDHEALTEHGRGRGAEEGPDALKRRPNWPGRRLAVAFCPIGVESGHHFLGAAGLAQIQIGRLDAGAHVRIGPRGAHQRPPLALGEDAGLALPQVRIAQGVDDLVIQRVPPFARAGAQDADDAALIGAGGRSGPDRLGAYGDPDLLKLGAGGRVDPPRVLGAQVRLRRIDRGPFNFQVYGAGADLESGANTALTSRPPWSFGTGASIIPRQCLVERAVVRLPHDCHEAQWLPIDRDRRAKAVRCLDLVPPARLCAQILTITQDFPYRGDRSQRPVACLRGRLARARLAVRHLLADQVAEPCYQLALPRRQRRAIERAD